MRLRLSLLVASKAGCALGIVEMSGRVPRRVLSTLRRLKNKLNRVRIKRAQGSTPCPLAHFRVLNEPPAHPYLNAAPDCAPSALHPGLRAILGGEIYNPENGKSYCGLVILLNPICFDRGLRAILLQRGELTRWR
jgi:hypothetical protein